MAATPPGCRPAVYARRRPEHTVLYRLVQQHLETYLALAREGDWDGQRVPAYAERELRSYLKCGILAYGFCRARCPACGHDFLVAFSCKGRGVCPSCNARRMAETAAHLVDHVFPPLPVRQWVLSVPKRLRWYLEREPQAVTAVLHIFLRVVEAHLRRSCPGASARARFGAVSFVHRFGASLNRHLHDHCCILDGVFEPLKAGGVQFRQASALTPEAADVIEAQVRRRVLHWFSRHGLLDPDDARDMLTWEHGGFSLDASVCIAGHDRAGLERLLRYCARPPFALERIAQVSEDRIVYRLPEPQRDGCTALSLTPLELIDHLVALIPPPRLHRHRYHGVLAPNAPLRLAATAYGRDADPDLTHPPLTQPPPVAAVPPPSPPTAAAPSSPSPAHYLWAMLLARLFESLPLVCPNCGADMRIIAFVTEAAPVRRILMHVGEPAEPPRISPARGPPAWDDPPVEAIPDWDALAQPQPEYVFNDDPTLAPASPARAVELPIPSPCADPTAMLRRAMLRRAIADRLARCQDFTLAAKSPGQSGKTLVCDPHQYPNIHLRSLAGFLEADRRMPPVRHVAGIERLSPTLDEQRLFARFMQEFGGENRAAFTDIMGNVLEIDRHLFLNLKGEWKIMKGERARWLLYTALNIRQPDEIWLEPGRQGGVDKRYYLSRFDVGCRGLLACVAVFERELGALGAWGGRTNFATTQDGYIERKRNQEIMEGEIIYWRWE